MNIQNKLNKKNISENSFFSQNNYQKIALRDAIDEAGVIHPSYCISHFDDDRHGLCMGIVDTQDFLQIHVRSSQYMKNNSSHKRLYVWSLEDKKEDRIPEVNLFIDQMEKKYYDMSQVSDDIILNDIQDNDTISNENKPNNGIFYGDVKYWENINAEDVYDQNGAVQDIKENNSMPFNAKNLEYFQNIAQADSSANGLDYNMFGGQRAKLRNIKGEKVKDIKNKYTGWKVIQRQFANTINMEDAEAENAHLWVYELPDSDGFQEGLTLRLQWYKPGKYAVAFVVHHDYLYADKSLYVNYGGFGSLNNPNVVSSNYDHSYPAYFRLFTGKTSMDMNTDGSLLAFTSVAVQMDENNLVEQITRNIDHLGLRLFSGIQSKRVDDGELDLFSNLNSIPSQTDG